MNFVVELSEINNYNILFIITNKFIKKIMFIFEKKIFEMLLIRRTLLL